MRVVITITVAFGDELELLVFRSDQVTPEAVSSTLSIAEQSVRGTLALTGRRQARIREYLGPALLKEELLAA